MCMVRYLSLPFPPGVTKIRFYALTSFENTLPKEKPDIILRNARVVDGTGAPWYKADVGIFGDRIAAVGKIIEATALEQINANGSYLSPGFIDSHTHDDVALLDDPH